MDGIASSTASTPSASSSSRAMALSAEEQAQVDALKRRDQEVRQHEMAHLSASGGLAMGGPSYQMQTGPDGQRYAVGGDVKIDASPGRTPEETIRKARIVQAAALAPAKPSGVDRAVAAQASTMEFKAMAEIAMRSTQQNRIATTYQPQDQPQSSFSAVA